MTFNRMFSAALVGIVVMLAPTLRAADVSGKWLFAVHTEGGDREVGAEFKVAGDSVTGTFGDSPVKGTWKDGKIDLAFAFTTPEGATEPLTIKGQLEGAGLKGDWTFGEFAGAFDATRQN